MFGLNGGQVFAICFIAVLVLSVAIVLWRGRTKKTTTSSKSKTGSRLIKTSPTLIALVILGLGDLYLMYLAPGVLAWLFSADGSSPVFLVLTLGIHAWIIYLAYSKSLKAALWMTFFYVLIGMLLCRWFYNPPKAATVYKAYETTSTVLVQAPLLTQAINDSLEAHEGAFDPTDYQPAAEDSADLASDAGWPKSNLIIPDGEVYYVIVPLKEEVVEVENLRLEKGDRLVPLMCLVVRPQLPGALASYDMTALGVVEYYQENGKPLYLAVKNYPLADQWLNRYTSRDKSIKDLFVRNDERNQRYAKNDNSVLGSLQLQLNGNWEWVRPPHVFQAADSAQPILLGANLQRGIGHEGASGYFRLIFRISHPIVVDSAAVKK